MTTRNFRAFAEAVAKHFAAMSKGELFRTHLDGDAAWQAYLGAFPEGSNPIYKTRTEHDGSYDRAFVRKLGNVVAINADGSLTTIWDAPGLAEPYTTVAQAMAAYTREFAIVDLFRCKETKLGVVSNVQRLVDGSTIEWRHFHADVARRHQSHEVDTECGNARTTVQVLERGLRELTPEALTITLDLIEQGALYRGEEFASSVRKFHALQIEVARVGGTAGNIALWQNWDNPVARLRNTAIGTLLQDLSDGVELERAVKAFELKVAPSNYKRPTALITQKMITDAVSTIRELDLESALERRFANLSDLSINNVVWADASASSKMKDGLTDLLMDAAATKAPARTPRTQSIAIADFVTNVLPQATGMEMFFANNLQPNLVSLTAPVHSDAGNLFKWKNNFAWSYHGNIADSAIKEKVKAAGGNTNAVLRTSLAWSNHDDLDLHAQCPDGHVYFASKDGGNYRGANGQILDVDMNAGAGTTREPVENLSWKVPKDGTYHILVNQYRRRETDNVGFTLEVENAGSVTQYSYPKAVSGTIKALDFTVKDGKITELKVLNKDITGQGISRQKWNLQTEQWVKVDTVLNSPNHWDGERTGNKHWFFILSGCKNDEPTRGIYNEFLKPELEAHRKVFEVLGNKTKCLPTDEQLSGLGFSSTQRNSVLVKVTGPTINQTYEVQF